MTPEWLPDSPTSSPSARSDAAIATDTTNHVEVLFGGANSSGALSDTWTWNGLQWTQLSPTTSPSARKGAVAAYDPALGKTVLYGGQSASAVLGDTWEWNGTNWAQITPTASPPAVAYASLAFDTALNEVVLFGGYTNTGHTAGSATTWVFTGTTWTQIATGGGPSARGQSQMAYDSEAGDMVLFGGYITGAAAYSSATYTLAGGTPTWTLQSPYAAPAGGIAAGSLVFDTPLNRLVLFGGVNASGVSGYTYMWDAPSDTWLGSLAALAPTSREGAAVAAVSVASPAYDGQLLLFGGSSGSASMGDTQIFDWPELGTGNGDDQFTVQAGDRSQLNVDLGDGNLSIADQAFSVAGTGENLSYTQSYDSDWGAGGWLMEYNYQNLELFSLPSGAVVVNGWNGSSDQYAFYPKTMGNFTSPAGIDATLMYNSTTGQDTLTVNKTQQTFLFDAPADEATPGELQSITDRNGDTIVAHYNGSNQLTSLTDTRGRSVTTAFDPGATPGTLTLTLADGRSAQFTFNHGTNQITDASDLKGISATYGYDSHGDVDQVTDPLGNVTLFGYDADYRVDSVTQVTDKTHNTGPTTTFAFEAVPPTTTVAGAAYQVVETNPLGKSTTYIDGYGGQPLRVTDANTNIESSTYSPNRDPMMLTNGLTETTTLGYDTNNNPTSAALPANGSGAAATGYQSFNTPTSGSSKVTGGTYLASSAEDANGNCSSFTYDTNGNPQDAYLGVTPSGTSCDNQQTGTGSTTLTAAYQGDPGVPSCGGQPGEMCSSTNGNSGVTSYAYDSSGQLTSVTSPGGSCTGTRKLCTSYTYDSDSRTHTVTDGNNQVTTYSYDNDDRVTQILSGGATTCTYSAGTCVKYVYDYDGNVTSRTDVTGTTTYVYGPLNRVTTEELPGGANACAGSSPSGIVYGYDWASNLVSYCDAGGTVTYAYDPANRVIGVATDGGSCNPTGIVQPCTQYTYVPHSATELMTVTYPTSTGVSESFTYNPNGTVTGASVTGESPNAGSYSYNWEQGTNDRLARQSMTHGSVTTTYSYDSHNQLLSATGTGTGATSQSYTYDGDGNLRTEDLEGTTQTMAYSSANELCWAYSGTSSDTCGTLPSGATKYYADADGNQTGSAAGLALSYNTLNQASSMTNSTGGTVTAMTYAGIGNTQRTAAGTTTFTNNSFGVASSTTSGATLYFTRDPSGTLNSMVSGGARYYYLYDGAGNIIGLFNNTGTQAATYSYDPYGNLINSSGTLSVTNPYRYAAGYTDHTGYDHFGARYYNPTLGAFTQTDPSGQNPGYNYASSDPINNSDPTGTFDDLGYVSAGFSAAAVVSDVSPAAEPVGLTLGGISAGLSLVNTIGDCVSGSSDCGEDLATTAIDGLTFGTGASFASAGDDLSAGIADAAGAVTDAVTSIF